jgi:hypothetical protein
MTLAVVLAAGAAAGAGCAQNPAPEQHTGRVVEPVKVPVREREPEKPLPSRVQAPESEIPPPPFDDVPLVNQRPPEQRAFVEAYEAVGRPRILVFVNRTLEGHIVPVGGQEAGAGTTARADNGYGRDRAGGYLRSGQYDEVEAKSLDYEAMENILTDWLASDGRVEVVSPVMARQRLTDEQVRDLQSGRPRIGSEVARQLDADVLVQVQAHPTRQTAHGLEVRVIAEAINVSRGGQSIARAVVEVPPPLDKPQLNTYTRFLARKLMDGMIGSWQGLAGSDREGPATRRLDDRPARGDTRLAPPEAPSREQIDRRNEAAPESRPTPPAGDRPGVPPAGNR